MSIITVTLNNVSGLRQTYESLASQTSQNFEWIVVDGNSSDETLSFLKNETNRIDNKIIISERDSGIYDAMNKGIRESRGGYLWFLNAGDKIADSEVLTVLTPYLEKDTDFVYGDAWEGGPPLLKSARRHKDLIWGMFTHHQSMLYRADKIKEMKLRYSILFEIAGDYDFTVRFLKGVKKILYIPKPLCVFEQGGMSQRQAVQGRQEQFTIREALDMVHPSMNGWIYCVQSAVWTLRMFCPKLYWLLKSLRKTGG